jgi:signal peptidase II
VGALLAAAAGVLAVDQASKAMVLRGPAPRGALNVRPGLVSLPTPAAAALLLVVVVALVAVVALAPVRLGTPEAAGLGLLVGGAASNLADRLVRGGVVDFIALGRWPAFNLADAAMVAGALLAATGLL